MLCKLRTTKRPRKLQETDSATKGSNKIQKTKKHFVVEAHEFTRKRLEPTLPQDPEDHIVEKGLISLSHYNLVHIFVPMPQALKIPDTKAAVDKDWQQLEKLPAWQLTKVKSKMGFILKARKEQRTLHFATLMDICHLKNAESEPTFHKYKGRVVLRRDICQRRFRRRSRGSSGTNFVRTPTRWTIVGKTGRGRSCWNLDGKRNRIGNVYLFTKNNDYSCRYTWITLRWLKSMAPMWKKLMKNVDLDETTSFLDHVNLGCTQRECKPNEIIIEEHTKKIESRISAGAMKNCLGGRNLTQKLSRGHTTWKVTRKSALKDTVNWR